MGPGGVVGGQQAGVEGQGEHLALPRGKQPGLAEGNQSPALFDAGRLGAGGVELHNLPSGSGPHILHPNGGPDHTVFGEQFFQLPPEIRITQAEAEGEPGTNPEGIKIPVAHKNALGVFFLDQVPIPVTEVGGGRVVLILISPGVRQLAAEGNGSGEHIGQGVSSLHPRLGHEHQGGNGEPVQKA